MANFWVAREWKVILATWSGPEVADFFPLDARVLRISGVGGVNNPPSKSRIRANLSRVMGLRRVLRSVRPDVVLSFLTESNVLTILAGLGLDVRVVVSERVQPALHRALPRVWGILRRLLYRLAHTVVAQTQDAADWLKKNCGVLVTVIPNALRNLPEPSADRRNFIVAVGRLTHQKGFDVLLRAFAHIASSCTDWRVAIVGEGEERGQLTVLRGELLLDDRVEFVGQTPDVVTWMAHAGIVVQPSRFEGFPNVLLESMGLGTAVISTDCPSGPADLIRDGFNGRLVPVDEVVALATVMAELISRPDERARLGRAASEVRELYRQEVVMGRWEACLFPPCWRRAADASRAGESK